MEIDFKKVLIVLLSLIIGLFQFAMAQDPTWSKDGEIKDVEIEILRERQITLPTANRNFEKVPPRPSEPILPEITYEFRNLSFVVPDYKASVRPLRLKQEEISKIYGNHVSAGFGNFVSPYLDAWLNTKRDKSRFVGAHLYHRSFGKGPIDGKNSASGNTELKLFGNAFTGSVTSGGFLDYENKSGFFYGYSPGPEVDRDSIRQSYNIFTIGGSISNTRPADFNFSLGGSFGYLEDYYQAAESELGIKFNSDYAISDKSSIVFNSDYYLIARKDSLVDANPRHLFRLKPSFVFSPIENLKVVLGVNAVYENDSIRSKSFHIYPNLATDYMLSKSVTAYARLSGDMDKVTLRSTSSENFWLNNNVNIFHTNRSLEFAAGLKGKLGKQTSFDFGLAAANLKYLYFFQNGTDRSKFEILYDRGNVQRINFFGQIGLNKNEVFKLGLRGDYFGYSTDKQPEAWHRPTYSFGINSSINVYQKLILKADLIGRGGMKALSSASQVITLDPGIDLNLKADYHLSKQTSLFLKFENILSSDYPMYLNYPVRGLQVLGGVSWSF